MRRRRSGAVDDELLVAPLAAGDEQLGDPLLHGARARVRRRGRGAAAGRRAPERGGAEEGRTDRAAHRGEHRQGHVRGARRRLHGGRRGEGGGTHCDLTPPAPLPARRAAAPTVEAARDVPPGRALRELAAAALSARLLRLPARLPPGIVPASRGLAAAVERLGQGYQELAREEGVVVGSATSTAAPRARGGHARGGGRCAHRQVAGGGGRRGLYEGLRRVQVPRPPRARRRAARPIPAVGRGAAPVRPPPRRAARRDARALPGRPRQRGGERAGALHPPEHRCVSGSSGSSA